MYPIGNWRLQLVDSILGITRTVTSARRRIFTGIYRRYLAFILESTCLLEYINHYLHYSALPSRQPIDKQVIMSETKENVLLFGLGGIGGIYASILSLSKAVNVHVVARSNYESVKEKGFKLVSQKFGDHDITFDGGESLF
jgi:hypothetical protein